MFEHLIETFELIEKGVLLHDQEDFEIETDCGTYRCLAGWDTHLRKTSGEKVESEVLEKNTQWEECMEHYGLSHSEANLLFDEHSTLEIQKITLNSLKRGKRIKDVDFIISRPHQAVICSKSSEKQFREFFGDSKILIVKQPQRLTDPDYEF